MRQILLSCALLGVLALPAAAVARSSAPAKPGYLVVRKAASDALLDILPAPRER